VYTAVCATVVHANGFDLRTSLARVRRPRKMGILSLVLNLEDCTDSI
jgi:hypothetical protein